MYIHGLKRFQDKVVVLTGGAQGLGEALAHRFHEEGAKLVVGDINVEGAKKVVEGFDNTIVVKCDVANYEDNLNMMQTAVDNFGRIDSVVCSAAISTSGAIDEIPIETWKKIIDINLIGFFYTCRAAVMQMKKQEPNEYGERGNIVQINSKTGKKGSAKNSGYAASKFGGLGVVQSLGLELATLGIRCNAICPGNLLNGPMWQGHLFDEFARNQGLTKEQVREKYINQVPMKRECNNDDVANAVIFMASDEAAYMTGQAINVTGGQEMK